MGGRRRRESRARRERRREVVIEEIRRRLGESVGVPEAGRRCVAEDSDAPYAGFEDARREPGPVLKAGEWSIWTWNPALEVEAFCPVRNGLIEAVKAVAGEVGPEVTFPEFRRRTGHARSLVVKHFGTWGQLRVEAGLERVSKRPQQARYRSADILERLVPRLEAGKRLSDEELLEEFDRVARKLGRAPTEIEFNRESELCRMLTLYKRFGRKGDVVRRWEGWRGNDE